MNIELTAIEVLMVTQALGYVALDSLEFKLDEDGKKLAYDTRVKINNQIRKLIRECE